MLRLLRQVPLSTSVISAIVIITMLHSNQPPPNGQENIGRLSINSLLNPEEVATFHPPRGASQVVLPLLGPKLTPPNSCGSRRSMSRSSRPTSLVSPSYSTIPYSLEQIHFIQYHREDKGMQWQAIVQPFKTRFPRVVFQKSNDPKRQKGALESRYYRAQMYPKIDDEGNLVLGQNGDEEMVNIKVRERRNHRHKAALDNYIKRVTRCPEMVLEYSWTDEEDKEKARSISMSPCARGLCCLFTNLSQLPLAQHRV